MEAKNMPLNNQVIFAEIKGEIKIIHGNKRQWKHNDPKPIMSFFFFLLSHWGISSCLWPPPTIAYQDPLFMGFCRQEHCNGYPFPSHDCSHRLQWFGAQENKLYHCFKVILKKSIKSTFSLSSLTFNKRFFSSSLVSAIRVMSSACLLLLSTQLCPTLCNPCTAACQASLSFTISWSLLKLISIKLVMPSNHPLSSPSFPAFSLSQHQGLFQCVSSLCHVTKVLELQLQHQSFQWILMVDFL